MKGAKAEAARRAALDLAESEKRAAQSRNHEHAIRRAARLAQKALADEVHRGCAAVFRARAQALTAYHPFPACLH